MGRPLDERKHELSEGELDVLTDILMLAQAHGVTIREREREQRDPVADGPRFGWTDIPRPSDTRSARTRSSS
jgi:hypothetical protein